MSTLSNLEQCSFERGKHGTACHCRTVRPEAGGRFGSKVVSSMSLLSISCWAAMIYVRHRCSEDVQSYLISQYRKIDRERAAVRSQSSRDQLKNMTLEEESKKRRVKW